MRRRGPFVTQSRTISFIASLKTVGVHSCRGLMPRMRHDQRNRRRLTVAST